MNSKDFLESILTGDEALSDNFNNIMAEKMSDALEVRKVEIASGIMDEASDIDKLGKKYAKAEKDEAEKQDTYSKKYPGGNKQKEAAKAAFMKRFANEEVEQIDELSSKLLNRAADIAYDRARKAGQKGKTTAGLALAAQSDRLGHAADKAEDREEMQKYASKAKTRKMAREEVEQVDEVVDAGTSDMQKDLTMHRTNLQKMNMAPAERSRVMTALKTHMKGRRLNMNQSSALLGYLGKAGGLGDVNASVRNRVLKQQSAKKDEV